MSSFQKVHLELLVHFGRCKALGVAGNMFQRSDSLIHHPGASYSSKCGQVRLGGLPEEVNYTRGGAPFAATRSSFFQCAKNDVQR